MKILLATDKLYPEVGGPYKVITETARKLIMTTDHKIKLIALFDGRKKMNFNINQIIKSFQIIHFFGGWTYFHYRLIKKAKKNKIKTIICPMGIFEPWSLAQKKNKKKFAMFIYQKRILNEVDIIQCTSANEEQNIKKFGKSINTRIIPHAIDIIDDPVKKIFFKNNKKRALFLSRLHTKKGIFELIKVWTKLKPIDWELRIIGPDNDGILHKLKSNIGENDSIVFKDSIFNEREKQKEYRSADLFILPTKNENFGMVILEAISMKLPTLTTTEAPWQSIEKTNSGWIINNNVEELEKKLIEIFSTEKKIFEIKSENAFLLSKQFNWKKNISLHEKMYKDILKN